MKDAIKNMFLMGVGAVSVTRKKAEAVVKVFVKKGVINNNQAKEIIGRVMKEAEKVKNRLKKEGVKEIRRVRGKITSARKKAMNKISATVNKAARKIVRKGMNL